MVFLVWGDVYFVSKLSRVVHTCLALESWVVLVIRFWFNFDNLHDWNSLCSCEFVVSELGGVAHPCL